MRRRTSCRSSTRRQPPARRSPTTSGRSTRCCCRRRASARPASTSSAATKPNIVRSFNLLDPTTALLNKYSPTYTCLFQGAQWYVDHGGRDALGGNGYSVILDAALLFGDDPYRYPQTPSEGQRHRRSGRQAQLWFAARPERELPGARAGHRHRLGRRSRRDPHQRGRRQSVVGQLVPDHQEPSRTAPLLVPRGAAAAMRTSGRPAIWKIWSRVALFTAVCLVFTFSP